MDIISTQKFIRMSPRKLRLVADVVRDLKPNRAIETLPHIGKRASGPLAKVIKTAIANAKQKGFSESDLTFKEIQINEGPTLKRGRPVSRGRWHPIMKRMSHIRVVLATKETRKQETKEPRNKRIEEQKDEKTKKQNEQSGVKVQKRGAVKKDSTSRTSKKGGKVQK